MRHGWGALLTVVALSAVMAAPVPPAHAVAFVEGSVASSNGPVLKGTVQFFATCEDYAANAPAASRRIDETGFYRASLNPGTYRILITPGTQTHAVTSWHAAQSTCETATAEVIDADRELDLIATGTAMVTGQVTSATGAVTTGRVSFATDCSATSRETSAAITYSRYSIEVPPGTYRVRIQPSAGPAVTSWHDDQATCEQAAAVSISGSGQVDLRARALYTVAGTVSSRNGPVTTGSVTAYISCQDRVSGTAVDSSRVTQGVVSLSLPSGQYWVFISTRSSHATPSWNGASSQCEGSVPITISGAAPISLTTLAVQKVKQPPTQMRQGRRAKLAARTEQGVRVNWKATPKKTCALSGHTLTARAHGRCVVVARTSTTVGLVTLNKSFYIVVTK